jgi:site-specific recombinase XerD
MRSQGVTTLSHESIELFRGWLSVRGRSAHTVKSYTSDLRMCLQEVGASSVPLEELEETGMQWLQSKRTTLKPKTTTRRLTSLKAFASWTGMPQAFSDFIPPVAGKPRPKPLKERFDGVRLMIEAADTEDMKVVIALCGFAGLRIHETLAVVPRNINLRERELTVRGKGDKERTVPISDELMEVIIGTVVRRLSEPRLVVMADRVAREKITRIARRIGLVGQVSSHHLRATFATQLMEDTHDLRLVQELLGHASSKTTEAYTQVTMDRQRKAVNDL